MKFIFTFGFIFINLNCFSQFNVICDPTYEPKLRTAIELVKNTDAGYFCLFSDYCSQIRITSDSIVNTFNNDIITVPLRVVSSPSINNLASWLVYQSCQLRIMDVSKDLRKDVRDSLCHNFEMNFRNKLPKEYGNTLREKMKKFFENLMNDPYHIQEEKNKTIPIELPMPEEYRLKNYKTGDRFIITDH